VWGSYRFSPDIRNRRRRGKGGQGPRVWPGQGPGGVPIPTGEQGGRVKKNCRKPPPNPRETVSSFSVWELGEVKDQSCTKLHHWVMENISKEKKQKSGGQRGVVWPREKTLTEGVNQKVFSPEPAEKRTDGKKTRRTEDVCTKRKKESQRVGGPLSHPHQAKSGEGGGGT